ncbi:MAG: hypothetical protein B6D57_03225 [Candidatus Coatesbacteria bacterium 4484_99]|uniref:non-specific protein-tyrosine kinase n=1 Tax=Candidatus Coatesbacteria bacterium 4484_99 TaxID=1970774 RepID=A0A1W9S0Q3_9BACT|nr:MAG: hypothetical protein B6D57_03225 [Candidatus Coatesbacteria bacterium 4484_99]
MNRLFEKDATLSEYLGVILDRKWMVLTIVLITVVITAIFTFTATPVYKATTVLRVRYQPSILGGSEAFSYYYWSPNFLDTEMEVIKSRSIALGVISKLKSALLTKPSEWNDYFIEFNITEDTRPGNYKVIFIDDSDFNVLAGDGSVIGSGTNGERFKSDGLDFILKHPSGKQGLSCSFTILNFYPMVSDLRARTSVSLLEGIDLVQVSVFGSDPDQITREANLLTKVYMENSYVAEKEQAKSTKEFIEEQLEKTKETLAELEERENELMITEGIYDIDVNLSKMISNISDLEAQKLDLEIQLYALNSEIERTLKILNSDDDSFLDLVNHPIYTNKNITDAYHRYLTATDEKEKLLEFYTEEHPKIEELNAELITIKNNIKELLYDSLYTGNAGYKKRDLEDKIGELEYKIKQCDTELERYPAKSLSLVRTEREKMVNENMYNLLLSKYQEVKIEEAMRKTYIRVIDPAVKPLAPIGPKHRRNMIMGMILGVVLGLLSSIVLELLDNTIHTPEEVERFTKLPLVGIIPKPIADYEITQKNKFLNIFRREKPLEEFEDLFFNIIEFPKTPFSESFRTLRTNMLSTMVGKKLNSILITSVDRNEGKTTICTNLAISFALTGRKTLLIDTDLRKSEHHRIFKVKRSPGISDICLKETVLKKAIRKTSVDNLFILTSGRRIPNPAEVLESEIMNDVIQQIDREFNIAIFDSPPILPVSDPMILGKKIDATFLIILADVSLIKSIDLAISSAESAGVKLKGVILNAMSYESTYGKYKYRYYYE